MQPGSRSTSFYHHPEQTPLLAAKMLFVGFGAAQEVKVSEPILYCVFQAHCVEQKPHAEIAELRIVSAIVQQS